MKLALIGTHGVGKTTLAYELCSLLKKSHHNVELVTEVARHSPFPVNAATTMDGQLWILHAQIAAELDASRRAPHVVTDRAVLDNYCYLVNKFGRQPQLESWLAWWMNTYDVLIGVPPVAAEIPADGFRSEDRAFQQRIHELLIELLDSAPFDRLDPHLRWLKPESRGHWADRIFAMIGLDLDRKADAPYEFSADNVFLRTLQSDLRHAIKSGSLRRDDRWESIENVIADFGCDFMDVVETALEIEERTGNHPRTVGEFVDSFGTDDPEGPLSAVAKQ
ncbi:MAG TPA: AAA family ATPase [Candidatus Acidoferrales bacterium]